MYLITSCSSSDSPMANPQELPCAIQLVATSASVNINEVATFEV